MVHFPGLARTRLCIQRAVSELHSEGFPHSDISGSVPACGSPELFAACHVLHRLLAPRHPPHALGSLTIKLTQHVAPAPHPNRVKQPERNPGQVVESSPFLQKSTSLDSCKYAVLCAFPPLNAKGFDNAHCQPIQLSKIVASEYRKGLLPAELATSSVAANKKPGVERRAKSSRFPRNGFARSSTDFYPVLVAYLTKGFPRRTLRCKPLSAYITVGRERV